SRLEQPAAQLGQASSIMRHVALGHGLALGIEQASAMLLRCPIQADVPANFVCHRFHLHSRWATATLVDPCTGAQGGKPPTGPRRGLSAGAQVLRWCSRHGVGMVAPGRLAPRQSTVQTGFERRKRYRVGKGAGTVSPSERPIVRRAHAGLADAWARRTTGVSLTRGGASAFAHPTVPRSEY